MREQLNNNPVMQIAVIGMLVVAAGFFFLSTTSGGEEAEPTGAEATVTIEGGGSGGTEGSSGGEAVEGAVDEALENSAIGEAIEESGSDELSRALASLDASAAAAPPLPRPVIRAYRADRTLVLLFVRDGGIDDRRVKIATRALAGFGDVKIFVVPAARIFRYAAITRGLGVDRVPALVVVTPRHLRRGAPTASVSYGFQSPASVVQAVVDAGYKGPTRDYHP